MKVTVKVEVNGKVKTFSGFVESGSKLAEALKKVPGVVLKTVKKDGTVGTGKAELKPTVAPTAPTVKKTATTALTCGECGSTKVQSRGVQRNQTSSYKRIYCTDCETWGRVKI